ncbi:MAG: Holliday junction resolvase RuvX [Candidatus Omnitrophota bacterium]
MPRIIGLDVGEKRVGVAVSDALNITAQGIDTIERKNDSVLLEKIRSLVKEYEVSKIIVGMPLNMNGSKGKSALAIRDFSDKLKHELKIDIELIDERLTSAQGERLLIQADVSRKKRKLAIDKIAAQLILQTYLDSDV